MWDKFHALQRQHLVCFEIYSRPKFDWIIHLNEGSGLKTLMQKIIKRIVFADGFKIHKKILTNRLSRQST